MYTPETRLVFQGSMVTSGQCIFTITATGLNTRLGKMGQKMDEMLFKKSPLQVEINSFVTKMAITGTLFFFLIVLITYIQQGLWTESLLAGLTIAMSVLPEEIPVAYTTFMALGAWRLIKKGIIVKKTDIVEALGNTRFLCLDKTGTITHPAKDTAMVGLMPMRLMATLAKDEPVPPVAVEKKGHTHPPGFKHTH